MISVEEALNRILDSFSPLGLETTSILDALGRVIGEDIYAGRAMPPKDHSTMDGYALRSVDTRAASRENPSVLNVIDSIPAGAIPKKQIEAGQAARIMTGAPLPEGSDTVVRMEDTRTEEDRVALLRGGKEGSERSLYGRGCTDRGKGHLQGRDHQTRRGGDAGLPRTLICSGPSKTAGRRRRDGR